MKILNKLSLRTKIYWQKTKNPIFLHYTGSMFGIGCSAFNTKAIKRIDKLKNRAKGKSYIVLIPTFDWLKTYNINMSDYLQRLLCQFWPGELTVILEISDERFSEVSLNGKVAFRIPSDRLLREFISQIERPIISTSVNIQNENPLNNLNEIKKHYDDWFDFAILPKNTKIANGKASTIIEINNDEPELVRAGTISFEYLQEQKPRILFMCTANICRSPIAEYYAKSKIGKDFRISSAGFLDGGRLISENSFKVLNENGINAGQHFSTHISEEIVYDSWLILTMTNAHKMHLIEMFPNAENKTFTLSEYAGRSLDVADPYGYDIERYRETYLEITNKIDMIINKLDQKKIKRQKIKHC